MKRILLPVLAGILLLPVGLALLVRLNADRIGAALSDMVEEATGRPLSLASGPRLSLFPRLGLTLGQAAWGGPDDVVSARLDEATITVAILPLLRGRVEIDEIRLDTPRVTLNLDAPTQPAPSSARTSSTPAAPTSSASPSPAPASPASTTPGASRDSAPGLPDFSLTRLEIADGHLSIGEGGVRTEFDDLALSASDLGPGRNGTIAVQGVFLRRLDGPLAPAAPDTFNTPGAPIASDAAVAPAPPATTARVRFSINSGLFLDAASLRLTDLKAELEGHGHTLALVLPADGSITFSLATETLTLNTLALSLSRNTTPLLTGSLSAAIQPNRPSGEASFRLEGSLRDALDACGLRMETRDPTALTTCSLNGQATLAETNLRLALNATVDGTPLEGEATLAAPRNSPMRLTTRLNAGQINVDRYLPPHEATGAPGRANSAAVPPAPRTDASPTSGELAAAPAAWPDLDLRLAVQRLTVAGISVDAVRATLTGAAGVYRLHPCAFVLYGGAADLTADAKLATTPPRYGLHLNITDIRLDDMLKDAAGTAVVDGRLSLSADLTASGPATAGESVDTALQRSLNGKGRVHGTNLRVTAGLIPSGAPAGINRRAGFTFSGLNGTVTAVNGLVTLRDVTLNGNDIDASAAGTVSLPAETLDVTGTIRVGGLSVPVRVAGPLRAPSYTVDTRRLLQTTVQEALKGGGNTKDKLRQTGKALKGLLGL